ncbi:MAG: glutathione S-transferase N-terminal domain-containing protein, partial [Pseudomonadota bacterium]
MAAENTVELSSQSRADLHDFPITRKWPPAHLDRLQLYAFGTPNGVKIPIALEELGIDYEAHRVPLSDKNIKSPEFLSLSPNNKIPAIIDPDGPDGRPIGIFESAAILMYLGDKA